MSSPPQIARDVSGNRSIVRRVGIADIEAVVDLAKGIPNVAQWSRESYETYCSTGQQAEAQVKVLFVVSLQQDAVAVRQQIVGFAVFSAIQRAGGGECELENMAVAERWRRQGIAFRLLGAGLLWCRAWCPAGEQGAAPVSGLSLEVRAANRNAIAFYERAGFEANGRRPGYYTHPDDDAVLMWKSLGAPL